MENEYDTIREAYRFGAAERYIHWAAGMAVAQQTGVPWIMCKQKDAPGEVVTTFFLFLLIAARLHLITANSENVKKIN